MRFPIRTFRHFLLVIMLLPVVGVFGQDSKTFDDGVARFKAGEYQAVVDLFTGMLADPEHNKRFNEDLYFYRGQAYYHLGNYKYALLDLDESLKLDHYNKATIHWYRARCEAKLGNARAAEDYYKDALAAAERNRRLSAEILADRSAFYSKQGKKDLAQKDLASAKSLNSKVTTPATTPNTTKQQTADEDRNTQVIVKKNNPPVRQDNAKNTEKPPKKPADKPKTEEEPRQTSPATMVSALAEAYKDEKRFALVIGNGNYNKDIGILKNPVNDATDVATELRKSDFEVQLLTNATYIQIREAMRKFQEQLTNGPRDQTVGLFYYAGHGVQYQDENYLVPIDANVKFEDDIVRMCFPVQRMVLSQMENTNSRMNIIILDACRNNPFPATTRSLNQGLAEMKRARGSFIAYATAPGSVASDGSGRNGLYTQELLKALRKPGLTIEQVFKEVRMNVLRLSGEKQYTWDSSNIIGEFYFKF